MANASPAPSPAPSSAHAAHSQRGRVVALSLAALGVVYGDIGTSPLYALRECFSGHHAVPVTQANVLGVLSLVFWSLIIVISIKYLVFILRADNHGEGGILALTALLIPRRGRLTERGWQLIGLGLFGAALLYGDGVITPAISVLSAVEGLEVATPVFQPFILPITIAILIGLFLIQRRGTASVGRIFGPITLVWFITLGLLGLPQILESPFVLTAINPLHGLEFFARNGWEGFLVLGAVFLVVTGGEALYADMGHFGPRPIRQMWFLVVLPGLLLNYFGQGALLLREPAAAENPFYHLAPSWALYPLVVLATMATVIASQAVISGAFSLTLQAVQLGFSPRVDIRHTSERERGQIYIPIVNWALMFACIGLVIWFRSSSNLAAAYGIAVTSTMGITTVFFYLVARRRWGWPAYRALVPCSIFLVIDIAFFGANLTKILQGGWFPLALAGAIFVLMSTWKRGRELLGDRLTEQMGSLKAFLAELPERAPLRVPGTAVYMYSNPQGVPPAMERNLASNQILHAQNVILTVQTTEAPRVPDSERAQIEALGQGFFRVRLDYGFMETPEVPEALGQIRVPELDLDPERVYYFLSRENLQATERPGLPIWRESLFALMAANARDAGQYFGLPPDRVVELGAVVQL